ELIDPMITAAQRVFSEVNASRSIAMRAIRPTSRNNRVCVVAPSRFRLWNDIGREMLDIFKGRSELDAIHFDPDDPACSSPLALLKAACECGALFTANTGRSDLPGVIPETIPWITWVTAGRVPSVALCGIEDQLIVSDQVTREVALRSGWNQKRVRLGGWRR